MNNVSLLFWLMLALDKVHYKVSVGEFDCEQFENANREIYELIKEQRIDYVKVS